MNANDVARQKYLQLINQVEDLEDEVEKLEKQPASPATQKKLEALREELAKQRNELTRVSDGCGTPHAH
jgi:ribosome-interacting GTPase 1